MKTQSKTIHIFVYHYCVFSITLHWNLILHLQEKKTDVLSVQVSCTWIFLLNFFLFLSFSWNNAIIVIFCNTHLLNRHGSMEYTYTPFQNATPIPLKPNVQDPARIAGARPLGGPWPVLVEFHKLIWNFIHKSICTRKQYRMSSSSRHLDVNILFIHFIF